MNPKDLEHILSLPMNKEVLWKVCREENFGVETGAGAGKIINAVIRFNIKKIGKYYPTNREALNLWDHTPRDEWSLLAFTQGIVRNYGPKSAKVLGKYLWYIKVIDSYTY